MRWKKGLSAFALTALLFSSTLANAADKILTVSKVLGEQGKEVTVDITVDNAAEIAGASFTVTYDTTKISLSKVDSVFFGTFLEQIITPTSITVGSTTYYSPMVHAPITTGSMLAAARKDNMDPPGTNQKIFTITFLVDDEAVTGVTPITIVSSMINNVTAGYSANGEAIPMLVGIGSNSTYLSYYPGQTNPGYAVSIVPGSISVDLAFIDTDGGTPDGINDNWEMLHFSNLTTANATSDFDKDGYSDLQEFKNRWEKDPNNASYDPKVKNAAGGTGYVKPKNGAQPAINLLLLK